MMTTGQMVSLLRELRGLERLEASIKELMMHPDAAPEWKYALVALDDRLRWCRYCLSLEPAALVTAACEFLLDEERTASTPVTPARPEKLSALNFSSLTVDGLTTVH
jgi:hypothetical protein